MPLKKSKIVLTVLSALVFNSLMAQVAIGTNNTPPDATAMLDVQSTSKGFLLPGMTSSQRRAITNPAAGLVVFDTDKQTGYLFNGIAWKPFSLVDISSTTTTTTGIDAADGLSGDALGINVKISGNYAVARAYYG